MSMLFPVPPASAPAVPVVVDDADLACWFAEIIEAQETQNTQWLALVLAAQRDFAELIRQLPADALACVQPRVCAEAVEALLERLRGELAADAPEVTS